MKDSIRKISIELRNGHTGAARKYYDHEIIANLASRGFGPEHAERGWQILLLISMGRLRQAYAETLNGACNYPDSPIFSELLCRLASIRAKGISSPPRKAAFEGKLILGCGTGRSGSTSLTTLLSSQPNSLFSHEHPPLIAWDRPETAIDFHLRRFQSLLKSFRVVGDVAHWWLPNFERVRRDFPKVKMIVIKRNREETVSSFMNVKNSDRRGGVNHWMEHDGSFWEKNPWDALYPKYETTNVIDALSAYWEDYYNKAHALQQKYPEYVQVFPLDALSDSSKKRELAAFLELEFSESAPVIWLNRNSVADGGTLYPNIFP